MCSGRLHSEINKLSVSYESIAGGQSIRSITDRDDFDGLRVGRGVQSGCVENARLQQCHGDRGQPVNHALADTASSMTTSVTACFLPSCASR